MTNAYFIERPACPACRSARYQTLYSRSFLESPIKEYLQTYYQESGRLDFKYLEGARYILDECLDCGLVFQRQVPGDLLMEQLYRERIQHLPMDEIRFQNDIQYYTRYAEQMMTLVNHLRKPPREIKVFDFGFGWAAWATMAVAFGFKVYGTELIEAKKQYARSHGIHVIEWEDIPNHCFDYVNADWVFEHLPKPLETFEQISRGLDPQGIIRISVPVGVNVKRRLKTHDWSAPKGSRNSLNAVHPLEHINCFEGRSLDIMAGLCGLRPVKIPIRMHYMTFRWTSPKEAIKSLTRPFYYNWYPYCGYRYYTPALAATA